jgi:hypothetical protein
LHGNKNSSCARKSTFTGHDELAASQTIYPHLSPPVRGPHHILPIGIDLPLKALVWQDGSGNTWLSYNDPGWLANRLGLGHDVDATVTALTAALDVLARAATKSP